ncbi:NYN domain-containing protein [Leptolyngbya sp. FACHB-711]|jgi:hypothetical protein|uniref:NYN domain-containing protein n=1 Tax=unclassified Leptolyngbya TaxID=2650499 RepID=UPI00168975E6|nr:NYN domain-containing protein [Leptolyngbya sp. FACHB-711]MBD1848736.1 NYN domain-containing protein [Cyanobacteria bacterium FACHB-502]MBD2024141.1 NYN domain-containing protein [Leptolyngbya sp. FACHB-711]
MPSSPPQALLLVDGYNVIGAWSDLKQTRDRHGLEEARRELLHSLMDYSSYHSFDTHVVFDAQYQDTPGSREVITSYLCICYTDYRQTADSYIEKTCALFRNDPRKLSQRLIVATSDRAQQLTVVGYGAEWMSAQKLQTEVELMFARVRRQHRTTHRQQKQSTSRFLASGLDPAAQQRLADLRFGKDRKKS